MPLLPHTRIVRPEPVILVADDDRDTRELYRACFDTSGFRTAEAGTGSQAIVSAVELVPDILLTDYVLPDIDGLTIARRLKGGRRTGGICILMVTGDGSPDRERHAPAAGTRRHHGSPRSPAPRAGRRARRPPAAHRENETRTPRVGGSPRGVAAQLAADTCPEGKAAPPLIRLDGTTLALARPWP